jgi:AbrB family looped-hinge helix DNA binding protein
MKILFPNWGPPIYNGIMNGKVTLDRAGRVVLPKNLRDELHLSPGDTLDVTVQGDEVTLRPRRSLSPLQKKQGVWVFSTGKPMASDETAEALRDIREQRDRRNSGETK